MSNFNSRTPYEGAEMGGGREHQFQLERRRHTVKPLVLAWVDTMGQAPPPGVSYHNCRFKVTCPDERILTTVVIQYVPDPPAPNVPPVPVTVQLPDTLHLMACVDLGGGPEPVEDLFGTRDAPQKFVQVGLLGFHYSPTEEVREMWGDLVLTAQVEQQRYGKGEWRVGATWAALYPISEEDWRDAVSKMILMRSPEPERLIIPG